MKAHKPLFVFSLPRSGSNLFAAYLHNHKNIWSINCEGGKINKIRNLCEAKKYCIYPKGGFYKDFNQVKYFLFDEMKPPNVFSRIFKYQDPSYSKAIVLVRNPLSIISSMDSFAKTYNREAWKMDNGSKVKNFVVNYKKFLKRASKIDAYWINLSMYFENNNIKTELAENYLGLKWDNACSSLPLNKETINCICGGSYKCKITNHINGTYFKVNNLVKSKEEEALECSSCKTYLLGYGGFNPINPINYKRLSEFKCNKESSIMKNSILSLRNKLGDEFTNKCLNNDLNNMKDLYEFSKSLY